MEILQVYIALIRSFAILDPRGVLLDRVARPIRRYLKDRDDTVKVIVTGLLADPDQSDSAAAHPNPDVLIELAVELNRASDASSQPADSDGELDWDDMNWAPDPIDAGPDYKKSKDSDVVGSLISLFESKDVFVKEFQNIMGERLLKKDFDYDREVRVLELLKLRFGEGALQVCEVMLRDVSESYSIDRNILRDRSLDLRSKASPRRQRRPSSPILHAKILSRLFWPDLHDDTFRIPPEISSLQTRYEAGFEKLKATRKLTWLPALGHATVELDLQDRVVTEECQTWQAAVIHAFHDPRPSSSASVSSSSSAPSPGYRSVAELVALLSMPEPLVRNALTFWVAKLVLHSPKPDVYTVLETLPQQGATTAEAQTAAAHTQDLSSAAGVMGESAEGGGSSGRRATSEKMNVYRQFVVGMLTNGGPMPLAQIVAMLGMVVPGGIDFGEEELGSWMDELVEGGVLGLEVGVGGGKYRII